MRQLRFILSTCAALCAPASAMAQLVAPPPVSAHEVKRAIVADAFRADLPAGGRVLQDASERSGLRPMRVAKWSVLAVAAGAGVYGFVRNNEADDRFRQLEELCQAEQFRCSQRTPDGAYADAEFERMYQDVRRLDDRSHVALLFSQIGVATGVALFLLDLGNSDSPDDIPWVPGDLQVRPVQGGVEVGVRVPVSLF
jgi:hypothetical protein